MQDQGVSETAIPHLEANDVSNFACWTCMQKIKSAMHVSKQTKEKKDKLKIEMQHYVQ
jgi:hypothetical protein